MLVGSKSISEQPKGDWNEKRVQKIAGPKLLFREATQVSRVYLHYIRIRKEIDRGG